MVDRSPYDAFMLHFHDWLKGNRSIRRIARSIRFSLPPGIHMAGVYGCGAPRGAGRKACAGTDGDCFAGQSGRSAARAFRDPGKTGGHGFDCLILVGDPLQPGNQDAGNLNRVFAEAFLAFLARTVERHEDRRASREGP